MENESSVSEGGDRPRRWPAAAGVAVEGPLAHVGLERLAKGGGATGEAASAVRFRALPVTGLLALRGTPDALGSAVGSATGLTLPDTLGASVADGADAAPGSGCVLRWRSPDEWLLSCPIRELEALATSLEAELGTSACAVDVSGGYALFELAGEGVDAVLARSTSYDIGALAPGRVVSTTFAKTAVMLRRIEPARVELIVRRSYADYVWTWLQRAAGSDGLTLEPFREAATG